MGISRKKQSIAQGAHEHMSVTEPGLFEQVKWALMRGILSTVGRTSIGNSGHISRKIFLFTRNEYT